MAVRQSERGGDVSVVNSTHIGYNGAKKSDVAFFLIFKICVREKERERES